MQNKARVEHENYARRNISGLFELANTLNQSTKAELPIIQIRRKKKISAKP